MGVKRSLGIEGFKKIPFCYPTPKPNSGIQCVNIILYEQGETMTGISKDMDLTSYRIPIGVCAGIAPFNFPAMIPLWMFPM